MGKLNMWLNGSTYGANEPVWKAWTVRKVIILAGSISALLIIGSVTYALIPHDPPRVKVTCVGDLGDDFNAMSERNIICKLQNETGKDIRDLMDKRKLRASEFKTFKEAETSARALYGIAKWHKDSQQEIYEKSAQAYGIAEGKVNGGGAELNHVFYLAYSNAALYAKDKKLYDELIEKAETAIKNDPTQSDQSKTEVLEELEAQKRLIEQAD